MKKITLIGGSFGYLLIGFLMTKYLMLFVWSKAQTGNLWYAWVAVVVLAFIWVPIHVAHMKLWKRRFYTPDSPHVILLVCLIVGLASWPYVLWLFPELRMYLVLNPEIQLALLFIVCASMSVAVLAPRWVIRT